MFHYFQRKDGKQLAGGSIDGMIRLYDLETGAITATLEGHAMTIRSLAYSDDGNYLITGSDDCHVKIYEPNNAELISTLSGHSSSVLSVAFSPDNKHFASRYMLLFNYSIEYMTMILTIITIISLYVPKQFIR